MELFTDQVMGELLDDDLGTASFDGSLWSNPHHRGGHAAGHFIKWHTIADQSPAWCGTCGAFASIRSSLVNPDLRLHLRRAHGQAERSRCGQRGWATPLSGDESALPDAGGSDDPQIANEVPHPQDELAFGFLTLK